MYLEKGWVGKAENRWKRVWVGPHAKRLTDTKNCPSAVPDCLRYTSGVYYGSVRYGDEENVEVTEWWYYYWVRSIIMAPDRAVVKVEMGALCMRLCLTGNGAWCSMLLAMD